MGRIRYIKPEFHEDVRLAEVSRDARLLYIGLWNFMDRQGLIEEEPRLIKRNLFPYDDDMTYGVVIEMLNDLCKIGRLVRVEYQGRKFLWCPTFERHQKFHPKEKEIFSIPNEVLLATVQQPSSNLPGTVQQPSSRVGIGIGIGIGMGIGMGMGTGAASRQPASTHPPKFSREELEQCFEAWRATLRHFKMGRTLLPDEEMAIARAADRYTVKAVVLALEGAKYEPKDDKFNPGNWVKLSRYLSEKEFNRFLNYGTKARHERAEKEAS